MTPAASVREFTDLSTDPAVRGFLHSPQQPDGDSLVLTHGAGANCQSRFLTALAAAFADAGVTVLRCDLPFRQSRPSGPPFPATAARDREGLRRAVTLLKQQTPGTMKRRIFLGGHSYGGRQASMLAADEPELVSGLLLLSYPLHPPRKPTELRTAHFPRLTTPALFVHGARDSFASFEELKSALDLIRGRKTILEIDGAGHELLSKKTGDDLLKRIVENFHSFFLQSESHAQPG